MTELLTELILLRCC